MSVAQPPLPSEPDELRTVVVSLQAELSAKTLEVEKLKSQLAADRQRRPDRYWEALSASWK
jgi:hypothetical protein